VLGSLIVVFICVIALPVAFMMTGAAVAALFGWTLKETAEATHEESELLETNY
jgi:hypothetical protein